MRVFSRMLLELAIVLCLVGTLLWYLFFAAPSGASHLVLDPAYKGPLDAAGQPIKSAAEFHAYLSANGSSPMKQLKRS